MAIDVTSAPQTFRQLKQLLAQVNRPQSGIRLGRRALEAFSRLIDEPDRTAVYSISELARLTGVNPSTLSRLAVSLGYPGFSAFQDVFRAHIATRRNFYSGRADLLVRQDRSGADVSAAARVGEEEITNILGMLEHLSTGELEAAADILIKAPRVSTCGLRQPAAIAAFAAYALGLLRADVSVLSLMQHGGAYELGQLARGDALLVFGFEPYTRATIATARVAANLGITIIAITDSHASPFLAIADHQFVAPTTGSFFSNSMAAAIVAIEGLLTVVARRMGDQALSALKRHEKLIEAFDIEL